MPANPTTLRLEQAYRDALLIRARQAVLAATARIATVDPDNLAESFANVLPALVAIITLGQRDAQILAANFIAMVQAAEVGAEQAAASINPDIAGTTFDGRPVQSAVSAFIPATFLAIGRGLPVAQALNIARYGVSRYAHTEVTDAAVRETSAQGEGSERMAGWTWVCGGAHPCGACLANQNGRIRPFSQVMGRHAGCSCIESPTFRDVPEVVKRPTGMQLFTAMTAAQQVSTFRTAGEAKAALVRSGRIDLEDLVEVQESYRWRDQIVEKSLDALGIPEDELKSILSGTTKTSEAT